MSVRVISGLPGAGKSLYGVYLAKKHYKKENSPLIKYFRYFKYYLDNTKIFFYNLIHIRKRSYFPNFYKDYVYTKEKKVINVYSNFPILLDKKHNLYSEMVNIYQLNNDYSFKPYSLIILDEIQLYYDSDEYKDFPREIARFNQAHRHYGIKDIYYISQHPSRVVKKVRNLTNEFYKVKFFARIPLLKYLPIFNKIGIFYAIIYYEVDSYGMSTKIDKKFASYDWKKKFFITNIKKLYDSYDTCYLRAYNEDSALLDNHCYTSKIIDKDKLNLVFPKDKGV